MNCDRVRYLLMTYLDDEVADADRESIEQHLKKCPDCQQEAIALEHIRKQLCSVLDRATDVPAQPEKTWAQIRKRIESDNCVSQQLIVTTGQDSILITLIRRLKMFVLGQPKWRLATASAVLLALIVGLSLAIPSFGGKQDMALAASQLVQNSQVVKDACGGEGDVEVLKVNTDNGRGYVLCTTNMGQLVNADIDLDKMKVENTELLALPGLSDEEKETAMNIAKADPAIQTLLDEGGRINSVYPVYSFEWIDADATQPWVPELDLMTVEVYHADGNKVTFVDIDLNQHTVKSIREAEVIQDSGPIIGEDGHDLSDICVTTVTDMTDGTPEVTEEQREKATSIARTDAKTKDYFDQGAVITSIWGFYERNLVFLRESVDSDPIISVQRYPLIVLQLELADAVWNIKIDLNKEEVVTIDSISQVIVQKEVRIIGGNACTTLLEPGELMNIATSDPEARRLLVDENGVIGVPIKCVALESTTGESKELMQVPIEVGQDTWIMEIDPNEKIVTQLTKELPVELVRGDIPAPETDVQP